MVQETGIKAEITDLDKFMSGIKTMQAGLSNLAKSIGDVSSKAEKESAPKLQSLGDMLRKGGFFGGALTSVMGQMGGFGAALGALGGPAGAAGAAVASLALKIGKNLVRAIKDAINATIEFAEQGLYLAGRFDEMEGAAIAVGQALGVEADKTREAINELEKAGIRYDIAAKSVLQLTRNQIDLANATDLAKIAQATGIIVNEDSSATMGRLTHAIASGNTAMLGYMQIMVKKNDIEREAKELYGKSTDALNEQQKMQARVNAIIKASKPVMGVYTATMDVATKKLRSLTGRELPTLGAVVMRAFVPAWGVMVDIVRDVVKGLSGLFKEGGALYPVMVRLGTIASILSEYWRWVVNGLMEFISSLGILEPLLDHLGQMLEWVAFQVLFLSKVWKFLLPVIVDTMRAVWDAVRPVLARIVEAFQGLIQPIRDFIEELGIELDEGFFEIAFSMFKFGVEMVSALAEGIVEAVSTVLIEAMNAIGNVLTYFLGPGSPPRIAPDIDKWGFDAITEWLKGMTEADFSILKEVQSEIGKYLTAPELRAMTAEMAQALATGADVDVEIFDAISKRAGELGAETFKLIKLKMELAAATERERQAEERLAFVREMYKEAQVDVSRLTQEYNDLLRAGAGPEMLAAKMEEVRATEQARDALADQVIESEAAVDETHAGTDALKEQYEMQKLLLDQLKTFVLDEEAIGRSGKKAGKKAKDGLTEGMSGAGDAIGDAISTGVSAAIDKMKEKLEEKIGELVEVIRPHWEAIQVALLELGHQWEWFYGVVTGVIRDIEIFITPWKIKLMNLFQRDIPLWLHTLKMKFLLRWKEIKDWVQEKTDEVNEKLGELKDFLEIDLTNAVTSFGTTVETTFTTIRDWIWEKLAGENGVFEYLEELYDWLKPEEEGGILARAIHIFLELSLIPIVSGFRQMKDAIKKAIDAIGDFLDEIAEAAEAAVPWWLISQSPSPFALGMMQAADAADMLRASLDRVVPSLAMTATVSAMPVGTMPVMGQTISSPTTNTNSVQFNTNVSDRMDEAAFLTRVRRIVREELGGS